MSESRTILFEEHLLLGASMEAIEDAEIYVPMSYPGEPAAHDSEATYLCDLTGLPYALISGEDAQNLTETSCAGKLLEVGECAFEAVLFGDGRLVGSPLVMRTGEREYCLLDITATNDACMEWIVALSQLRQGDMRVFGDVSVEDATDMLVPLLLSSPEAHAVLGDYLSPGSSLPAPGEVRSVALDRIQALVACVDGLDDSYIVFVPPGRARVLWRSFLSFPSVNPLGMDGLRRLLAARVAWLGLLGIDGPQGMRTLSDHGLIRRDGQFVGMRGLIEG